MTRLSFDAYLDHIGRESRRFRDVLADCDPAARVPSCPDWDASDLLWHLTQVQAFWAGIVRDRPAGPQGGESPRPATYAELLSGFDEAHAMLLTALESADPADAAWTWAEEQTVGFSYRRQAHEALIHRLDAELAAGDVTGLDPLLAADGVDEALTVVHGVTSKDTFEPMHLVRVDLRDTDTQVWVELGTTPTDSEPRLRVVTDAGGEEPDVVVEGLAADVDAWLWNRVDDDVIHVAGDRAVHQRFVECVRRPIG